MSELTIKLNDKANFFNKDSSQEQKGWINRMCRKWVLKKFEHSPIEGLHIRDAASHNNSKDFHANLCEVLVHDNSFYTDLIKKGSIGAAESYMEGKWDSSQLYELFRKIVREQSTMDSLDQGSVKTFQWLMNGLEQLTKNTLKGSKKNIAAHYDLGNDFFKTFLDPTLCYSSGIYENEDDSLETASMNKIKRICEKLDLKANENLIEIGSGWGALAIYAAKTYGCKVTTTTLSEEQYKMVEDLVAKEGLSERVTILLKDYRELKGTFDKLVSVEMIEAVGHEYHEAYLNQCDHLLKPGGKAMIQAILIDDERYPRHLNTVDFIQKYIFPGSIIPSLKRLERLMENTELALSEYYEMGQDYAKTLLAWNENFQKRKDTIRELGYPESFIRMWEYYLNYCAAGFKENYLYTGQLLIEKKS